MQINNSCPNCELGCDLDDHQNLNDLDWYNPLTEQQYTMGELNPCNDCGECTTEF